MHSSPLTPYNCQALFQNSNFSRPVAQSACPCAFALIYIHCWSSVFMSRCLCFVVSTSVIHDAMEMFQCACDPFNPAVAPSWCCPLTTKVGSASASATRSTSRSKEKLHFEENFPSVSRTASFCNSNRGEHCSLFSFLFSCLQLISTIILAPSEHCLISSRRCSDSRRRSHISDIPTAGDQLRVKSILDTCL